VDGDYLGFIVRYSGNGALLEATQVLGSPKAKLTLKGFSCFPDGGSVMTGRFFGPVTYGSEAQPLLDAPPYEYCDTGTPLPSMYLLRLGP
jgi:hypothetical protein